MNKFIFKVLACLWIMSLFISCGSTQTVYRQSNEILGYEKPLTLRVKIVLLQRDDGSGNFDLNDPVEAKDLKDYVNSGLNVYKNFIQPSDVTGCYDGLDFMPSALIDFEVEYAEVRDTYGWNYRNTGSDLYKNKITKFSPSEKWYLKAIDDSISNAEKKPTIHMYLTIDGERYDHIIKTKGADFVNNGKAAGQFPTQANLSRSSQVHLPNVYLSYISMKYQAPKDYNKSWQDEIRNWFVIDGGKAFAHELGHNLGLAHSNEHHRSNKCKYSIMSQKHEHPRNYLQPTEIKKIHKNLRESNLMQFVTADSHYGFTQAIAANETWNKPRRFYNDFVIKSGVKLTIEDKIIMPLNAKITIENNGTVQLSDGAKVVYPDGRNFDGWVVHGRLIE